MKKHLIILLFLFALYTGCTNDKSGNSANISSNNAKTDIDLTALSSTMVYAEVYNILSKPISYLGKNIKLNGLFYSTYYDVNKKMYYYVVIDDAASCCLQGIEFVWNGEHKYPDENAKIEVSGIFSSYNESGETYYYLLVEDLRVL